MPRWVTLLVGIEMPFCGMESFGLLFGIEIRLTSNLQDVEAQKNARVDPRRTTMSMLNKRMQNLDTKKEDLDTKKET